MHNSATINLNVLDARHKRNIKRDLLFVVGLHVPGLQPGRSGQSRTAPRTSAYPAAPDSEYGWEKLFSERLYLAYGRNHGMRGARRALSTTSSAPKARGPAARRRRRPRSAARWPWPRTAATIEIWGDGEQTRSFLYIDECLEGTLRLTALRLRGAGEHRLRRDGDHQPAGRHGRRHRRQDDRARTTSPVRSACAAATPTTG